MNLTITGPRSVGKTTICKEIAKKLKLKYISSDEMGEKAFEKQGGLDKAIKSGAIKKFIEDSAYSLIRGVYAKEDNFVFDLSGGAVSSDRFKEVSELVRTTAKKNSFVIGMLPSKNSKESIAFLFEREKEREHFRGMDKVELFEKVEKSFNRFPGIFSKFCGKIVYTKGKSTKKIVEEIIEEVK